MHRPLENMNDDDFFWLFDLCLKFENECWVETTEMIQAQLMLSNFGVYADSMHDVCKAVYREKALAGEK